MRQLFKECDIWRSMNHSNVLKISSACHVSSLLIVCEYTDRGSLFEFIAQKGMTRGMVLDPLYHISQGLCYLHGHAQYCGNIVLGDLKCSSILVSAESAN